MCQSASAALAATGNTNTYSNPRHIQAGVHIASTSSKTLTTDGWVVCFGARCVDVSTLRSYCGLSRTRRRQRPRLPPQARAAASATNAPHPTPAASGTRDISSCWDRGCAYEARYDSWPVCNIRFRR